MNPQQESPQIEQTQSNSNLVISNPVKQNNTLVIILSFLLLISMSVSGYFAYQTQTLVKELTTFKNTTTTPIATDILNQKNDLLEYSGVETSAISDWNIYTNSKYGFSFMYPKDWKTSISPTSGDKFNLILSNINETSETGLVPLQFSINMATTDNKITTLSDAESAYRISKNQSKRAVLIDGKQAVSVSGQLEGPGPGSGQFLSYTFIDLKGEILVIQLGSKIHEEVFNQILSTFKFTDLNTTSDWKTYANEEIGITLKYPDTWSELNGNLSTKNKCNFITLTSHFYNSSLSDFLSKEYNDPEYKNNMMPKITTIGGKEAQVFGSLGIGEVQSIYIKNGARVISIRETASVPEGGDLGKYWETNCKNFDAQTDKILSTIKFTN